MERTRRTWPNRLTTITAALAAAGMLGCAGANALNPTAGPVHIGLRAGEKIKMSTYDWVTFERVSGDSRCPVGTKCVWAGAAEAHVSITSSTGQVESGTLTVGADSTSSPPVDVGRYRLQGLQLDPYPKANQTIHPADYRLTLRIERTR